MKGIAWQIGIYHRFLTTLIQYINRPDLSILEKTYCNPVDEKLFTGSFLQRQNLDFWIMWSWELKTNNSVSFRSKSWLNRNVEYCAYTVNTHTSTWQHKGGNKISVGAISKSRSLHMALWLDVLFTSACQQHTSSKICQCDDHAHSTWSFSPTHIFCNSCLRDAKSLMQEKDFSVRGHKWSSLRPISVIDFARPEEHRNACLPSASTPNPPLLCSNWYIYPENLHKQKSLCCPVACRASFN